MHVVLVKQAYPSTRIITFSKMCPCIDQSHLYTVQIRMVSTTMLIALIQPLTLQTTFLTPEHHQSFAQFGSRRIKILIIESTNRPFAVFLTRSDLLGIQLLSWSTLIEK